MAACRSTCSMKASSMQMNMYMLDIMYAPTNWLTLMVMPMWMSHDMTMKPLAGAHSHEEEGHEHTAMDMAMDMETEHDEHGMHMGTHSHGTTGFGDTTFGPMVQLAGRTTIRSGRRTSPDTGSAMCSGDRLGQLSLRQLDLGVGARSLYGAGKDRGPLQRRPQSFEPA